MIAMFCWFSLIGFDFQYVNWSDFVASLSLTCLSLQVPFPVV